MKNVLITGGTGYLGGRIASFLSKNPELNLIITTRKNIKNISIHKRNVKIINLDLMSENDLKLACNGVEHIIHLAALDEIESQKNPERAFNINSLGTLKLLRIAEVSGVKRFIYISTAHVYGSPLEGLISEETATRPSHPYSITHRAAEDFVLLENLKKAQVGIVLRLSNAFGRPASHDISRWTLLVNDLCRQAVIQKKLVLRSSGMQNRDWITISDVSRAVSHFLYLPADKCLDGLFNLGGESVLKIIDMAKLISDRCLQVLGYEPPIANQTDSSKMIYYDFQYSIEKLKSTGFTLTGEIYDEIDNTLLFCQDKFGNPGKL
jgi:UDP-glucose 4-epimerase